MKKCSKIIELARGFNNFFWDHPHPQYTRLTLQDSQHTPHVIGLLPPKILESLSPWQPHFLHRNETTLEFVVKDPEKRSKILHEILLDWKTNALFHLNETWRNENFSIKPSSHHSGDGTPPLLTLDRSVTPLFGMKQYGVHINGFVRNESRISLWLQKRAKNKQMWPGLWDNLVGGGLSTGNSIISTATKESLEEASIPSDFLLKNLKSMGTVSFFHESSDFGLFPNTEFVFDLELSNDFQPVNRDGEVEGFVLVGVEDALEIVKSDKFKVTSLPVVLDFLVRHGVINCDNENLPSLLPLLHVPLELFYK